MAKSGLHEALIELPHRRNVSPGDYEITVAWHSGQYTYRGTVRNCQESGECEVVVMSGMNVLRVAKYFCEKSGWTITNLKLQKLVYLAHMVHMGRTGGEHLVNGCFEAWDYGPVHPDLYHAVKAFGNKSVMNIFKHIEDVQDSEKRGVLDEAYEFLGEVPSWKLVYLAHRPGGGWSKAYETGSRNAVIKDFDILEEYREYD